MFACWKTLRIENNSNSIFQYWFPIKIDFHQWKFEFWIWVIGKNFPPKSVLFFKCNEKAGISSAYFFSATGNARIFFLMFENKVRPRWHEIAMKRCLLSFTRDSQVEFYELHTKWHTLAKWRRTIFIYLTTRKRDKYFTHFYYSEVHWIPLLVYLLFFFFQNS